MDKEYIDQLKKEYNEYILRHCKAEVFFADNNVKHSEKEKMLPEYSKIMKNLSRILNTLEIYGVQFTEDQVFGGFSLEE